jgi:hypothetical protein
MDDADAAALFAVEGSYTPAVKWMPRVVNFNILPDMGRMTARLRSVASHGCSVVRIAAASVPR